MSGNSTEAGKWNQQSLIHDTNNMRYLLQEGLKAHFAKDYSLAIEYYDQMLVLDPHSELALYNKAVTLQHAGDFQGAADLYDHALQANPFDMRSLLNLAVLHHKYGALTAAQPLYERGLTAARMFMQQQRHILPEWVMVQSNLGALYLQLGWLRKVFPLIV